MKRIVSFFLAVSVLFCLTACANGGNTEPSETEATQATQGQTMDTTGKYLLDESRNEAILDGVGTAAAGVYGNARVYYHIFVGSFSDSDGDGIGDLRGIINRFDYLNDGDPDSGVSLGVEGIWLSPIFVSSSYHKYDTSDYYKVDPQFGTEEDLKQLIALCHERGVQIILDLVINHTSASHAWFEKFWSAHRNQDVDNEYYDFYSWRDGSGGTGTYSPIGSTGHYYECNFSTGMPELNFDNEAVRQAMVEVARYYLNMGVDGFRFDAAKYIYYNDNEKSVEFWDWYMAQLRAIKPDIYTVAEVWDGDGVTIPYFSATNCFNFSMSQSSGRIAAAAKGGNVNAFVSYVDQYLKSIQAENPDAMMVTFISNHDMDRTAGFLMTATGHAQMAANLSILLPGSSFIYYGEEIGMLGSRGGANTDANRRLAMLWGDGDTVRNPAGSTYTAEQSNGTVADQLPNGDSLYNHYKKLILIRKANPEIAYGEFTPLKTGGKFGGFLCSYQGKTVAVIHNTTTEQVTMDLSELTDAQLTTLAAYVGLGGATLEGSLLTIDAQTSVVLR